MVTVITVIMDITCLTDLGPPHIGGLPETAGLMLKKGSLPTRLLPNILPRLLQNLRNIRDIGIK
jgi:hypothetical protein